MNPSIQQQPSFRVVVGFDFSTQSLIALQRALNLASGANSEVHIVTSLGTKTMPALADVDPTYEQADAIRQHVGNVVGRLAASAGREQLGVFIHTRIGSPAKIILHVASEIHADMILVGTHSRTGVRRWVLGSVSENVARHAPCPVLIIRETHYESEAEEEQAAEGEAADLRPEPPCPACVTRRKETAGKDWWCEYHASTEPLPYEPPLHMRFERDEEERRRQAWGGLY